MSIFEGILPVGIILVNCFQVKFIYTLKDNDPKLWAQAGKPTLFNSGGIFGVVFFVLFNEHKSSDSKHVVTVGNWYRFTFIALLTIAAAYFVIPLEFWYG